MKKNKWVFLAAAAAATAYGAISGKGIFNKPRFKEQHDAVSRYVNSHYPDAAYTHIAPTEKGWVTAIRQINKPEILLYISKTEDGIYIFHEMPSTP